MTEFPRFQILGVEVDLLTVTSFFALIRQTIEENTRCVIANHNLHSVYLYHHDAEMCQFYQDSQYRFIDGMPIVFWMKLLGLPAQRSNRFTSTDWIDPFMKLAADSKWRIAYVGSEPDVVEHSAAILRRKYPSLDLMTLHGYFDSSPTGHENQSVVEQINAVKPNVLFVGLGMPQQEHWILNNAAQLEANCIIPIGACFDYIAGSKRIPPRWMSRLGFEWLGRLITEPRRLWRRYLIEPWFLLQYAAKDLNERGWLKSVVLALGALQP